MIHKEYLYKSLDFFGHFFIIKSLIFCVISIDGGNEISYAYCDKKHKQINSKKQINV